MSLQTTAATHLHNQVILPVLGYASCVLLHGRIGAHAVEQFVLLAVLLYGFTATLRMTCEHSSQHHKVSPRTCQSRRFANQVTLSVFTCMYLHECVQSLPLRVRSYKPKAVFFY